MTAPSRPRRLPDPPVIAGAIHAWWLALRPRTLGASLVPVAVGSAIAADRHAFRLEVGLACAAVALLLQVTANLVNDAADFRSGVDTDERLGPLRVTQAGLLPARQVLAGAALCTMLALCAGAFLVSQGGLPILLIGLAGAGAALGYSVGPFPLASHGLGELAAFLFFGLIAVTGTAYLHSGGVPGPCLEASLAVGALVSSLMLVNNLRDIESDRAAGKRTLAVRMGADATRRLYTGLLTVAYLATFTLLRYPGRGPLVILPALTLPLAIVLARRIARARSADDFRRALAGTAQLHLAHGSLLTLGLLA